MPEQMVLCSPLSLEEVKSLRVGDLVLLNGLILTARDAAHKYLACDLVDGGKTVEDRRLWERLRCILDGGVIYHCGPVAMPVPGAPEPGAQEPDATGHGGDPGKSSWRLTAAGPTTSMREEMYEGEIIRRYGVRAVIGKGGMGRGTLAACQKYGAVYLHTVGGAAAVLSRHIREVKEVFKPEFGWPEAMWLLEVEAFPAVVTMDAYGRSRHEEVAVRSAARLQKLMET